MKAVLGFALGVLVMLGLSFAERVLFLRGMMDPVVPPTSDHADTLDWDYVATVAGR